MLKKIVNGIEVECSAEEESQLRSEWDAYDGLKAQYDATLAYQDKRKAEYPPIEEYLDGIVKGDQNQVNDYLKKCLEVKAKYPKPERMKE